MEKEYNIRIKADGDLQKEIAYMALDQNISQEDAIINAIRGYLHIRMLSKPHGSAIRIINTDQSYTIL